MANITVDAKMTVIKVGLIANLCMSKVLSLRELLRVGMDRAGYVKNAFRT